ncbi:MAG: hypothetical protein M3Z18_02445, partial [Gemmatimonadota bacterium]|nr:hypothetical protein [Gemmatimonadota bacterium]
MKPWRSKYSVLLVAGLVIVIASIGLMTRGKQARQQSTVTRTSGISATQGMQGMAGMSASQD